MSVEVPGERPRVLTEATRSALDELRRFRHFVRHGYGARLDRDRIRERISEVRAVREALHAELDAFQILVGATLEALRD